MNQTGSEVHGEPIHWSAGKEDLAWSPFSKVRFYWRFGFMPLWISRVRNSSIVPVVWVNMNFLIDCPWSKMFFDPLYRRTRCTRKVLKAQLSVNVSALKALLSTKWKENSSYAGLSPYLSALDLWHSLVWNIEFDELEFFLVWTGFLKATQAVKIQFKQLDKIPIHQTLNFKLENVKIQVQIDSGFF